MHIFYDPLATRHEPPFEVFNGEQTPHQEQASRVTKITRALLAEGYTLTERQHTVPPDLLLQVHAPEYLKYLEHSASELGENDWIIPSVFPYWPDSDSTQLNPVAQRGQYAYDTYTPITRESLPAALGSAGCAYEAATLVGTGSAYVAYALCRPPGHHAESSRMGGYCYFNNAAIAAQYFSHQGRVATLDVDFHHGNGTQAIFYERADVLTTSIHAHPTWKFPYFSGFPEEMGRGDGENANVNLPLQAGTTNEQFQIALHAALQRIQDFGAQYLVISFGADTHEADPIGGFKLTTDYFHRMANTINELQLPTVIVQEGGYNTELLGKNVATFLSGFEQ